MTMAYAGLFNEQVDIMKYTPSTNEYGEVTRTLVKEYTLRAKVIHLSGSRTLRNDEVQIPYSKTFVLRYHAPIREDNLIRWDDKLWRVQSIDHDRNLQQVVVITEIVNA